jgi:hypothetical protein
MSPVGALLSPTKTESSRARALRALPSPSIICPRTACRERPICGDEAPYSRAQGADAGVWFADGALGQFIVGDPALDLLLVVKNYGNAAAERQLWDAVRPALVALDPRFHGDEDAFCASDARGDYTPDLR